MLSSASTRSCSRQNCARGGVSALYPPVGVSTGQDAPDMRGRVPRTPRGTPLHALRMYMPFKSSPEQTKEDKKHCRGCTNFVRQDRRPKDQPAGSPSFGSGAKVFAVHSGVSQAAAVASANRTTDSKEGARGNMWSRTTTARYTACHITGINGAPKRAAGKKK